MPKDGLSGKNLDYVSLSGANMAETDLSHSSLRHARLTRSNLRGADLRDSDLHDAHLAQADVTDADLSGADLTGADLQGVDLDRAASLEGAKFDQSQAHSGSPLSASGSSPAAFRWDSDARSARVAEADGMARDVQRLADALKAPTRIAELLENRLPPGLEQACVAAGSPWTFLASHAEDETPVAIEVRWDRTEGTLRELRADAFALLGTITESVTFVQQRTTPTAVEYRIVTGTLDGDDQLANPGSVLVLRVVTPQLADETAGGR
jgi:hypothetical protein